MSIELNGDSITSKVRKLTFGWNDAAGSDPDPLLIRGLNGMIAYVDSRDVSGLSAAFTIRLRKRAASTGIDLLNGEGVNIAHNANVRIWPKDGDAHVVSLIRDEDVYLEIIDAALSSGGTIDLYVIQEA